MGKVLFYIYDNMADFEFTWAAHLLGVAGQREVITIAGEKNPIKSKCGIVYQPHARVEEALHFDDIEALIITGGYTRTPNEALSKLIRTLSEQKKLIASICAGPQFLAHAGILQGRSYTTTLSVWDETLQKEYGSDPFPREGYREQRLVRDGNLITAVGLAFVDFAVEICDWFQLFQSEEEKNTYLKLVKGI